MSFKLDVERVRQSFGEKANEVIRGTIIGITNRIIKRTPVGNPSLWEGPAPEGYVGGALRGSWRSSLGAPEINRTPRIDKSGGSATAEASSVISKMKGGDIFYLTNALPYARRIEFGHSSQAPAGMVRRSVAELQAVLDKA